MFTEERQSAILLCLQDKGKVKVKNLSEKFQVSEDCIRKDLKTLENAGKLKRTYGGAIISGLSPPEERDRQKKLSSGQKEDHCRKSHGAY